MMPLQFSLKNINFEVKKGQFVAIIGEYLFIISKIFTNNIVFISVGSGKSSLFSSLIGEMQKSSNNEIFIDGKIILVD